MTRRWKALLPLLAVLVLIGFTLIVHATQQADPDDESFLSPVSTAGDGAAELAGRLSAAGVEVDRRTSTPDAIAASTAIAPATLLVTTPGLVNEQYLSRLGKLPAGSRLVLVAPDARALSAAGIDAVASGSRWAAAAPEPGCAATFATGPAAVLRSAYAGSYPEQTSCYAGGLLDAQSDGGSVTLVGAPDAFRNDRSGEHDNQKFAVALLSRSPRVVWLDLHEKEKPPTPEATGGRSDPDPRQTGAPEQTTQPGGGDREPGDGSGGQPGGPGGGRGDQQQQGGGGLADSALAQAFPPAFWAVLLLLVLAGIALIAASARRLGTPVAEPLPVPVRAAETVRGLGGLYKRARARDTSLATVQGAAVHRLAAHFGLPPDSTTADVADRAAAYAGMPPEEVRAILGAGAEDTDRDLTAAATAVQQLERYVTQRQVDDEGNVP